MLIDKGIVLGEIITFKLSSGEELIAKIEDNKPLDYVVSKPMVLTATAQGIGMIPYLFTVDQTKNIPINKSLVVVAIPTEKSYADQYIQSTTSIKLL